MLPVGVVEVSAGELRDVDETHEERPAAFAFAAIHELVDEALATAAAMDEQILHLHELAHVRLDLEVGPARSLAHLPLREAQLHSGRSPAVRIRP